MKTAPESRKIASIIKSLRDNSLQPQPEFQRRAVWTSKDKIAFIETILMGYPFPEIYVASGDVNTETGEAIELLVDGQQRVRTFDEYFRGVSPFARTQAIKRYTELDENEKKAFLNYDVSVRNLGIVDHDEIRTVFQRMNATSYDLNDMERYNAVYLGEFKQFCEKMAQHDFFQENKVFSAADIRRMKDTSFIASLTATMMSDYFNRDDEIEDYLERYNEEFEQSEEMLGRFNSVFGLISEMEFEKGSRAWRKADFYTLFVELDRQVFRNGGAVNAAETASSLKEFYAEVDAQRDQDESGSEPVSDYFRATLQSTNDRGSRVVRGRIIAGLLQSLN